jgi:hypothetical protein
MGRDEGEITVIFRDFDSDSDAFAIVRRLDGKIAFSTAVHADGDLDVLFDRDSAERIARALLSACANTQGKSGSGGVSTAK